MTRSWHDRSLSFGSAAAAYERGRPSYPPEAIDWLLPTGARNVLDLGAGTGKLTTRLVERGLDVVAVDPIPDMLEVLRASLPETVALLGTAEEIPLQDNSVDAVLVAQAWHWVDPERAIPEVARVLRPGGRLGLVWNTRDERLGWVRELGRIIGSDGDSGRTELTLPAPFSPVERSSSRVDELPDTTSAYRPGRFPKLLHYLADRGPRANTRPGARVAGHPSGIGEFDRLGAAVCHRVHPGDAGGIWRDSCGDVERWRLGAISTSMRAHERPCASVCHGLCADNTGVTRAERGRIAPD